MEERGKKGGERDLFKYHTDKKRGGPKTKEERGPHEVNCPRNREKHKIERKKNKKITRKKEERGPDEAIHQGELHQPH
jgi:hypothetical protein